MAGVMESKEIAQRSLRFAVRVVKLYERLSGLGGAARALAPQILRCGTSIGANLEEATAGQTKPDFITKVSIARKEARETLYWLHLVIATGLLRASDIEWELSEANQIVIFHFSFFIPPVTSPPRSPPRHPSSSPCPRDRR
jgi:four helix bundle protein